MGGNRAPPCTARHGTARPPAAPRAAPLRRPGAFRGYGWNRRAPPRTVPPHTQRPTSGTEGPRGTLPRSGSPPCRAYGCGLTRGSRPLPAAVPAENTLNSRGTNFFLVLFGRVLWGGRMRHPRVSFPAARDTLSWAASHHTATELGVAGRLCQGCNEGLPHARGLSGAHLKPTGERLSGERLQLCLYL